MNSRLQMTLQSLLEESLVSAELREQRSFSELAGSEESRLILFGVGALGRRTLAGLRSIGIEPIAFSDNNSKLWSTTVNGLPVLSPYEAVITYGNSAVFVLTIWNHLLGHPLREITSQLNKFGSVRIISFAYLYWKYNELFLPFFNIDRPCRVLKESSQVMSCYHLWSDEASRREYIAQVRLRLLLDFKGLPDPVSGRQYFPENLFVLSPHEVFIDCGAFDGDTLRDFLAENGGSFGHYWAFEPDEHNYLQLKNYVSEFESLISSKIDIRQFAVGNSNAIIRFSADGSLQSSVSEDGTVAVRCIRLDDLLDTPPTFIKMDVEGAEPDVINGAAELILKYSPILAVSVYHQCDHLWKLPLLISTLSDQYNFFLRPHHRDSWDLVCYAIPHNRLVDVRKGA